MDNKKYGTQESNHLGECVECKEKKITRLYQNLKYEDCSVCDDCYLKNFNKGEG